MHSLVWVGSDPLPRGHQTWVVTMEILLLALLAVAGIPAAIVVSMLLGQCVGGAVNCACDLFAFLRARRHAGA